MIPFEAKTIQKVQDEPAMASVPISFALSLHFNAFNPFYSHIHYLPPSLRRDIIILGEYVSPYLHSFFFSFRGLSLLIRSSSQSLTQNLYPTTCQ